MSFSDAFDALVNTVNSVFGSTVTYSYLNGDPDSEIEAVFDNAFVEVNGVTTQKPILKNVRLEDLTSAPVQGDTVTINEIEYTVQDSQLDTFGTTTLILEKS
jgi:Mg/Co/Ni transporter MgtE